VANGGMDMQESIVIESPRRRVARRVGAAGMALAAVLVLGACRAEGGEFIGDPLERGPVSVFQDDAEFASTSPARWQRLNGP
jgi:hypothetical protein